MAYKNIIVFLALCALEVSSVCQQKQFEYSSFVCVCNADSCELPGPNIVTEGSVELYSNSKSELRFERATREFGSNNANGPANCTISIDTNEQYQSIIGFGGAFTDSNGINLNKLTTERQNQLLRAYWTNEGADYNIARIPIAGSDFSVRPYSYDDVEGDVELVNFAMAEEDILYKFPYIKQALNMTTKEVFLFGSPWSPPAWMKTNGMFNGSGELLDEMWQPWANYFVKFVEAYEAELGIQLWGLTTQNEPLTGFEDWGWNTCGWTAEDMRDWIALNLGPTLEAAGMRRLMLMVDDYNRLSLPWYPAPSVLAENSTGYVDGIAVHWYDDQHVGPDVLDETHYQSPQKFMLYTEACSGFLNGGEGVWLGDWQRGEDYITNIIEDLNHWQTGWVDWNMCLDMTGGPNWANNLLDSPIIVNEELDEFYMQPMYLAMTHFSKFIQRDAIRVGWNVINNLDGDLHVTALLNPDNTVVLVIANTSDNDVIVTIRDQNGDVVTETLTSDSWHTVTYSM